MPPEKFSKINFEITYFLHFANLKLSSAVSARFSIRHYIIARPTYMGLDRYSKCYAIKPILAIAYY